MSRQQYLFLALLRAENDLEQALLCVASGTMPRGSIKVFEDRIARIRAL